MIISKDKYLNKWVVWSRIGSAYFMRYSSKLKKDCINYVKKHEKKYVLTRKLRYKMSEIEKELRQELKEQIKENQELEKKIDGLITVIDLAKQFIRNAGCYEEETDTFCEDIANYQLYDLINILERVNEE